MPNIVLTTLNARYIHSALGLRYLKANMGALLPQTHIQEYVIESRPIDIAESLLALEPKIVGFGVYIWNIAQTMQVVALIKNIRPEITVIIGGPEVSYEYADTEIYRWADYLITGAADLEFSRLCAQVLQRTAPASKVINAEPPPLAEIRFPYEFYSDEDIAHRIIYVEASRGCPFKCEFCLSALDKTAWPFDIDAFLQQMQTLYERGARRFKFVDRTFNIKIDTSVKILRFFLERLDEQLFLHFEVIPDHLPEPLKALINQFPEGSLQFEVGIQTFNPQVQKLISRKQNNEKSKQNLLWLRNESQAHLHTDLILGLPGEDINSIADSFNQLVAQNPHEIQVGILKRLRGSPIIRHTQEYAMVYNPHPPYNVLSTNLIDFETMQRLTRFARYWDMIANSGRFYYSKPLILGDNAFERFLALSDWLFAQTRQTHKISLNRLFELVYHGLAGALHEDPQCIKEYLWQDYQHSGQKKVPAFIHDLVTDSTIHAKSTKTTSSNAIPQRQARHIKN